MNPTEAKQEADRQIAVRQAALDGKMIEKGPASKRINQWPWVVMQFGESFNWEEYDYRIASEPPKWPAESPDWAQWMATNEDGVCYVFEYKPYLGLETWQWESGTAFTRINRSNDDGKPCETWRDSLIQRPQEKPEPKQAREFWVVYDADGKFHGIHTVKQEGLPEHLPMFSQVHLREVLPGRMAFREWWKSKGQNIANSGTSMIAAESAWDASAANGEDALCCWVCNGKLDRRDGGFVCPSCDQAYRSECERSSLLTRERDEARKELDRAIWEFDSLIKATIKSVTDDRDKLRAELATLKTALEPGKSSAIIFGLFREAERLGFYKPTGKHALAQFVEEVEKLRSELSALTSLSGKMTSEHRHLVEVYNSACDAVQMPGDHYYFGLPEWLKSQKGGLTTGSVGDQKLVTKDKRSEEGSVTTESTCGSSAPPHASGGQPEGKEGDAPCPAQNAKHPETSQGSSGPSPKVQSSGEDARHAFVPNSKSPNQCAVCLCAKSNWQHQEGAPTRGELGQIAIKVWYGSNAYTNTDDRLMEVAQAVRDRLAAVGELSFHRLWSLIEKAWYAGDGATSTRLKRIQVAVFNARATREPKGDSDKRNDPSGLRHQLDAVIQERDALRQQLAEKERHWKESTDNNEFLRGQLSNAQAEMKRLDEALNYEKANHEECEEVWNCKLTASQTTVARLRALIGNAHLYGAVLTASFGEQFAAALASITAPTASVQEGAVVDVLRHGEPEGWPDSTAMQEVWQREDDGFDFVVKLKEAQTVVEASPLWKKFIDGTPLSNDIAVWMCEFARDSQPASAPAIADIRPSGNRQSDPTTHGSVPTELVEACLDALQRCRDGYVITGEPRKLLDKSIALCNRHLSGDNI